VFALMTGVLVAPDARAWVAVRVGVARPIGAVAVGVAAGAIAGAAVASAAQPDVVVQQVPVAVPVPAPAPAAAPAVGTVVTALPPGCASPTSSGRVQCGSVWYQPFFGSNGVYYQVVTGS
jgi:hypothetical protein